MCFVDYNYEMLNEIFLPLIKIFYVELLFMMLSAVYKNRQQKYAHKYLHKK
jgi:hypothetical protein